MLQKGFKLEFDDNDRSEKLELKECVFPLLPKLNDIMDWLAAYFGSIKDTNGLLMLKKALVEVNKRLSSEGYHIIKTYKGMASTICMLKNWKKGKIVFHHSGYYVMVSFEDFRIRRMSRTFDQSIASAWKHSHLKRNWIFIKNLFDLQEDFMCFIEQKKLFGKYCYDYFRMDDKSQLNILENFISKQFHSDHIRSKLHKKLLSAFKNLFREKLASVIKLLSEGCYNFDQSQYNAFLEDLCRPNFSSLSKKFLNRPTWINFYRVLNMQSVNRNISPRSLVERVYAAYSIIFEVFDGLSAYDYPNFKKLYYAFLNKDLKKLEMVYLAKYGYRVDVKGELFVVMLLREFNHSADCNEVIEFLKDVLYKLVPFDLASNKLIMLRNPAMLELYAEMPNRVQQIRKDIRSSFIFKKYKVLLNTKITVDELKHEWRDILGLEESRNNN